VNGAFEVKDRDIEPGEAVGEGLCVFHEAIMREGC